MASGFDVCVIRRGYWHVYTMDDDESNAVFTARDIANNYKSVCVLCNSKMQVIYHHCKDSMGIPSYIDVRTSIREGKKNSGKPKKKQAESPQDITALPENTDAETDTHKPKPELTAEERAFRHAIKIGMFGALATAASPVLLSDAGTDIKMMAMLGSVLVSIIGAVLVFILTGREKQRKKEKFDFDRIWSAFKRPAIAPEQEPSLDDLAGDDSWMDVPDLDLAVTPAQPEQQAAPEQSIAPVQSAQPPAPEQTPQVAAPTPEVAADDPSTLTEQTEQQLTAFCDLVCAQATALRFDHDHKELRDDGDIPLTFYLHGAIMTLLDLRQEPLTLGHDYLAMVLTRFDIPPALTAERLDSISDFLQLPRYAALYRRGESDLNRYLSNPALMPEIAALYALWDKEDDLDVSDVTFKAVLFTDIVSFTEQTRTRGARWMRDILQVHNEIARQVLAHFNGVEIKHTGDGVLTTFESVTAAVQAGVNFQKGVAKFSRNVPQRAFDVRLGISAGEVVMIDGDIFGSTVNLAARMMQLSRGQGVLLCETTRTACFSLPYTFEAIENVPLKGFDPQTLYYIATDEAQTPFRVTAQQDNKETDPSVSNAKQDSDMHEPDATTDKNKGQESSVSTTA